MKMKHFSSKSLTLGSLLAATILVLGYSYAVRAQWSGTTNIYYNGGNVGIGTASPQKPLHVVSPTSFNGIAVGKNDNLNLLLIGYDNTNNIGAISSFAGGNASSLTLNASGGNVGIGTTSPSNRFNVQGGTNAFASTFGSNSDDTFFRITNSVGGPTGGALDFGQNGISGSWLQSRSAGNYASNFALLLNPNGGNVGIGLTNPQYKLDVAGNINSSATITGINIVAKYQDVAEWVPSSEQIAFGTVVVLDSTKSNQVISSSQAYDTRVAGVVSEQPGIALGESGVNKVLVATTGRVLVNVDATRAPIHIGDLLVTSDVPGVAMKSEPVTLNGIQLHRPGTIIGKALEPLEKGSGAILVLLSLQ